MDFSNLAKTDGVEAVTDSIGGFGLLASGLYKMTIEMAYMGTAPKGSKILALDLVSDTGQRYSETIYLTSGTAKGVSNTYKKGDKEFYLPGFILGSDVAELAGKVAIDKVTLETKTIQKYNFLSKQVEPVEVETVKDLIGKQIIAGIIRFKENKRKPNDAGKFLDTNDIREGNYLDRVFDITTRLSSVEKAKKVTTPTFLNTWHDKWKNKVEDTYKFNPDLEKEEAAVAAAVPDPFG